MQGRGESGEGMNEGYDDGGGGGGRKKDDFEREMGENVKEKVVLSLKVMVEERRKTLGGLRRGKKVLEREKLKLCRS